jgi:hypothetical protein
MDILYHVLCALSVCAAATALTQQRVLLWRAMFSKEQRGGIWGVLLANA